MSENIMYKNIADKMKNDKEEIAMLKLEIERLNDVLIHKPDTKLSLETEDGKQLFIIQSERIDMQEELNKANMQLMKELQDYKTRCEKAVKYIKKHIEKCNIDGYEGKFDNFDIFTKPQKLLNILNGSDE